MIPVLAWVLKKWIIGWILGTLDVNYVLSSVKDRGRKQNWVEKEMKMWYRVVRDSAKLCGKLWDKWCLTRVAHTKWESWALIPQYAQSAAAGSLRRDAASGERALCSWPGLRDSLISFLTALQRVLFSHVISGLHLSVQWGRVDIQVNWIKTLTHLSVFWKFSEKPFVLFLASPSNKIKSRVYVYSISLWGS